MSDILPEATKPKRRCSICDGANRAAVDTLLAADFSYERIERETRAASVNGPGRGFKSETVKSHLQRCMMGIRPDRIPEKDLRVAATGEAGSPTDFAKMVQQRAIEEMAAGRLQVTTKDGLAAQKLLDERADRDKGRDFVLALARALSGGGGSAPEQLIESGVIEGDFKDVTPPAENPLLAPANLRE